MNSLKWMLQTIIRNAVGYIWMQQKNCTSYMQLYETYIWVQQQPRQKKGSKDILNGHAQNVASWWIEFYTTRLDAWWALWMPTLMQYAWSQLPLLSGIFVVEEAVQVASKLRSIPCFPELARKTLVGALNLRGYCSLLECSRQHHRPILSILA